MKNSSILLFIITIYLSLVGAVHYLLDSPVSQIPTDDSAPVTSVLPLSFSSEISIKNQNSATFTIDVMIDEDAYLYFQTHALASAMKKVDYTDFAEIFANIDEKWWALDPFSTSVEEYLGPDLTKIIRDFLTDLTDYDKKDLSEETFSYKDGDALIEVKIDFRDAFFSTPDEYSDFSEFFIKTFEN